MSRFEQVEITEPLSASGFVEVELQDQHTPAFDTKFSQVVGSTTTLASDAAEHAYSISVTTGHSFTAGDNIALFDTGVSRGYAGQVLSIAGNNTVNLDTPINFAFPSATTIVSEVTHDLAVNGSGTRQTFLVSSPASFGISLDITRIMFAITTTAFPEMNMFGDIAAGLTRGVVLRAVNGTTTNLWNAKDNHDLILLMHDVQFYEAAKHGVNGLGARLTYSGPDKHGVTIRLDPGDSLELIIQDDLTSLLSFEMAAAGHIVSD